MSAAATLAGVAVSLAALGYLAATDPKRRRAFRLPAPGGPRCARLAWTAALLPGLAVPFLSGGGGFVIWFGAVSVAGWGVAAVTPARFARARTLAARAAGAALGEAARLAATAEPGARRFRAAAARLLPEPTRERIAELEWRVRELEIEVAELRRAVAPARPDEARVLVDMVRPAGRR